MAAKFTMPETGTWEQRGGWVVRNLAKDLKLTHTQTAGIVGNFGAETGAFKLMQEIKPRGGRGGYGWAQWTGPRRINFEEFCAKIGLKPSDSEANYRFTLEEFRGPYKHVLAHLRTAETLEDAVRVIHVEYETPQDVLDSSFTSYPKRLEYARRALEGAKVATRPKKPPRRVESAIKVFNSAALRLQKALQSAGYYEGELDSDFGPASRAALLAYLRQYHSV